MLCLRYLQVYICGRYFIIIVILSVSLIVHTCLRPWSSYIIFNFILFSLFDIFEKAALTLNRIWNLLHITFVATTCPYQWCARLVIILKLRFVFKQIFVEYLTLLYTFQMFWVFFPNHPKVRCWCFRTDLLALIVITLRYS